MESLNSLYKSSSGTAIEGCFTSIRSPYQSNHGIVKSLVDRECCMLIVRTRKAVSSPSSFKRHCILLDIPLTFCEKCSKLFELSKFCDIDKFI